MSKSRDEKKELYKQVREDINTNGNIRNDGLEKLEEKRLNKELTKVRLFPGSIAEYEAMKGYKVRVIDISYKERGVEFWRKRSWENPESYVCDAPLNVKRNLIENEIEAIVNCQHSVNSTELSFLHSRYGLPVAKCEVDDGWKAGLGK